MLARLGIDRSFLLNPATWVTTALFVIAVMSAVHADRNFTSTCYAIAPMVIEITVLDIYFVQPLDNRTYEACKGRIPARYAGIWPLSDCNTKGGWSHWSNGNRANFPQNCRSKDGNVQVF